MATGWAPEHRVAIARLVGTPWTEVGTSLERTEVLNFLKRLNFDEL